MRRTGPDGSEAYRLAGASQFDLVARSGAAYRVFVYVPPCPPPRAGFPVLYVLDGNAVFATAVEAIAVQMRKAEVTGVPPAVVVGIGYPIEEAFDVARRTFDLTPPAVGAEAEDKAGGAGAFFRFLHDEVEPCVRALAPLDLARQAIFGHSFGGLFVLWALFNHPGAFASYIAASPSIWWGGRRILDHEQAFARRDLSGPRPRLLITVGSLEGAAPAASPTSRMVDDAEALARRLSSGPHLDVTYAKFDGENHVSVIPAAISRSVRFAWT